MITCSFDNTKDITSYIIFKKINASFYLWRTQSVPGKMENEHKYSKFVNENIKTQIG